MGIRVHAAIDIGPAARRAERDVAAVVAGGKTLDRHDPHTVRRAGRLKRRQQPGSGARLVVRNRLAHPACGADMKRHGHSGRSFLGRGKGRACGGIVRYPSRSRNPPSAVTYLSRWQVSRLADVGAFAPAALPPSRQLPVASGDLSGHGRGGGCASGSDDRRSHSPCRIPSSPAYKTGTSAASPEA